MKYNWIHLLLALLCLLLTAAGCTSGQTVADTQEAPVLAAAEVYRNIYESVYSGDQSAVHLTDDTMQEILSCLGDQGYIAVDVSNRFAMENTELVQQFFDTTGTGNAARITIYQICWDGGFVCHDLSYINGNTSVILTSLAWLSEKPYALPGDIPTIRYSNEYTVTEITLSDNGWLEYEYDMPNNPPGENHDGHIDTIYKLAVSVS